MKPGDDFDFGPCILDTARFFSDDSWGYAIICTNPTHKGPEPCPDERDIFRLPKAAENGGSDG